MIFRLKCESICWRGIGRNIPLPEDVLNVLYNMLIQSRGDVYHSFVTIEIGDVVFRKSLSSRSPMSAAFKSDRWDSIRMNAASRNVRR